MKDYDKSVLYHPDKDNIFEDALSHITIKSVSHHDKAKKDLAKDVHNLSMFGVRLKSCPDRGAIAHNNSESSLEVEVNSKPHLDIELMLLKELVPRKLNESFSLGVDGVLRYKVRSYVPDLDGFRDRILEEAHGIRYSIHLGSTKM